MQPSSLLPEPTAGRRSASRELGSPGLAGGAVMSVLESALGRQHWVPPSSSAWCTAQLHPCRVVLPALSSVPVQGRGCNAGPVLLQVHQAELSSSQDVLPKRRKISEPKEQF